MNANERADAIIEDILTNHLPRVVESLKAGYVDEHQMLVIYDHAVRARILKEFAEVQPALEHVDNLTKLNRELEAEWKAELDAKASFVHPGEKAQDEAAMHGMKPPYLYEDAVRDAKKAGAACNPPTTKLVNVPTPGIPCGVLKQVEVPRALREEIEQVMAIIVGTNTVNGQQVFVAGMDGGLPVQTSERGSAWVQRIDDAKALATEWTRRYADMTWSAERVSDLNRVPAMPRQYSFVIDKVPMTTIHRLMTGDELKRLLPEVKRNCVIFEADKGGLGRGGLPIPDTMPIPVDGGVYYTVPDKVEFKFILDREPRTIKVPTVTGAFIKAMLPEAKRKYALFQEAEGTDPDIAIHDDSTVTVDGLNLYSVPPATFGMPKKLTCICNGEINELPTSIETLLQCAACKRIYMDEDEVARVKQTEFVDASHFTNTNEIYYTTGTLANGTDPIPMETEINLNGQKTKVKAKDGKFILSYEQIVRMTINQDRDPLNRFTGSDDELPMLSCVFHHRVSFQQLKYERDGSLWARCSVECTPGMSITCVSTSNA